MNIDQYISDIVNGYSELLARRENAKIMSDKELPMSVTVEEARKLRYQLEQEISDTISAYTDKTGIVVEHIHIDLVDVTGANWELESFYGKVKVEVRL